MLTKFPPDITKHARQSASKNTIHSKKGNDFPPRWAAAKKRSSQGLLLLRGALLLVPESSRNPPLYDPEVSFFFFGDVMS